MRVTAPPARSAAAQQRGGHERADPLAVLLAEMDDVPPSQHPVDHEGQTISLVQKKGREST